MNILIDLRPLMGGKISGVEVYIHHLLENLLAIDSRNTYILFLNAYSDQSKFITNFQRKNVVVVQTRIPNKLLNLSLSLLRRPRLDRLVLAFLKRRNRMNLKTPPIDHVDLFFMPDLRLSALSKGVKKVMTVHDLAFEHFPHFFSRKTRFWYKILHPKREIKLSDKVIAVSKSTADDLMKTYSISASKIEIVYEGVDEDFGEKIDQSMLEKIKKKYQLPSKYFLCLSTLEPRKNLSRLLEAFMLFKKKNPNEPIKLVIAGKEQSKIFSQFHLPHTDEVILSGFIDEQDKAAVMKGAVAFLYPSLFEGFGLPLVEAMQAGVPIMTSRESSMAEIVDAAALIVDPYNVEEMAQTLEKILLPEVKGVLTAKMNERVKIFRWKKCAQTTLGIFNLPPQFRGRKPAG